MAAARVDEPSEIALAAHMRLQLVAVQAAGRCIAVVLMELTRPGIQFAQMARLGGDMNMAGVVVAIDLVLADQSLREIQRLDGQIEQAARVRAPHLSGERLLTCGEPKDGLPAAAARGSIAHGMRLQQDDSKPPARQMKRGRAARDAPAE